MHLFEKVLSREKKKKGKIVLTVTTQGSFWCLSSYWLQNAVAKWIFFFLCQQILYKCRSGRPQNNLVPCYSFIFKAHESTNSLVHGWFLIAFSWQWISAWTRQAWCDPCWVKINFFSQWCAGTNPSYLLPSFSHLCMTSWLALPEFHHWLNKCGIQYTVGLQTVIQYCQFALFCILPSILQSASEWNCSLSYE